MSTEHSVLGSSLRPHPTPWLDGKHAIFGKAKRGMGVVKRVRTVRAGAQDRPVDEVQIVVERLLNEEYEELGHF